MIWASLTWTDSNLFQDRGHLSCSWQICAWSTLSRPVKKIPRAPLFWFLIRSFAANRSLFLSTIMDSQPIASTSTLPPLSSANHERQIAIRLSTKDTAYSIPSTKFLVPSSWRRFHLSELINKVLENCEFSCLVA